MDSLNSTVRQVLEGYAGEAANGYLYLTISPDERVYTVVGIGTIKGQRFVNTGIVIRLEAGYIIIERDQTDKIVLDALLQEGVPRDKIILAYMGEPVPATTA